MYETGGDTLLRTTWRESRIWVYNVHCRFLHVFCSIQATPSRNRLCIIQLFPFLAKSMKLSISGKKRWKGVKLMKLTTFKKLAVYNPVISIPHVNNFQSAQSTYSKKVRQPVARWPMLVRSLISCLQPTSQHRPSAAIHKNRYRVIIIACDGQWCTTKIKSVLKRYPILSNVSIVKPNLYLNALIVLSLLFMYPV